MNLIKEIKPDVLNISRFFSRPGTLVEHMTPLPGRKIKERSRRLTTIFKKILINKNQTWINWKGEVIIEKKGKNNSWIGRNFAYKPIIIRSKEYMLGKFLNVCVKKAFPTYLEAVSV